MTMYTKRFVRYYDGTGQARARLERSSDRAPKTCPHCGFRDVTTTTKIDGQVKPSCQHCAENKVVDPGEKVQPIIAALRHNPGATLGDLMDVVGLSADRHSKDASEEVQREYDAHLSVITRAVKAGKVRRERVGSSTYYYLAEVA